MAIEAMHFLAMVLATGLSAAALSAACARCPQRVPMRARATYRRGR